MIKFYDLGITSSMSGGMDDPEIMIEIACELGFAGVAFADFNKILPKEIKSLQKKYEKKCEIYTRATIIPKSVNHMKEQVKSLRNRVDFIAVKSNSDDKNVYINAILDKRVDIISFSELKEFNCLDYSHFKMARDNFKVMEIVTRNLIDERVQKSRLLRMMNKACIQLVRAKAPFIISSGAFTKWELRGPEELVTLAGLVKIPEKKAITGISKNPKELIQKIEMIKDPNYVMAGVRKVLLSGEEKGGE